MASAYWIERDKQWVADFRPLGGVLKQRRRVRIDPKVHGRGDQAGARAFAAECERYCRLLEQMLPAPEDIDHAARIGAISADQATNLRAKLPAGPPRIEPSLEWSIRQAAEAHPSTQRDMVADASRALTYLATLEDFGRFAGVSKIAELRLQDVLRWVEQLKRDGRTYDARRHRLLYLKRASRMGATVGLPDPLSGLRIDRRDHDDEDDVEPPTLEEVGTALRAAAHDRRLQVAIALEAFVGLRPSECFRADAGDLDEDLVDVGKRVRKNRASRRTLPLPPTLARWCRELARGRAATAPLIESRSHRKQGRFAENAYSRWLGGFLSEQLGRPVKAKELRKSFSTWARRRLDGRDIERFMGHQSAFLADVTSQRYLGAMAAEELRPASKVIEQVLRTALKPTPKRRSTASFYKRVSA